MNPLQQLAEQGQSIWLDYIRRGMTRSGELKRLIEEDGLRGMTSNPAIFQKSITGSDDYDDVMGELIANPELDAKQIFERLAVVDIREAADALRSVYEATDGVDGYVSLEVSPSLAFDADGTIEEARRLWEAVGRDNLMIKVPGTPQGLRAIEQLIGEGINVNVTLIFSRHAYRDIAHAYLAGLERRAAAGGELRRVASVASFFVSRIDTEIDARLDALRGTGPDAEALAALRGQAAVANAKLAYAIYQELTASARWQALAARGARPQRLLWASTGTKDPAYSDVKYIDELCGPDTVNTAPPQTVEAFRDHGRAEPALLRGIEEAPGVIDRLAGLGIDLDEVTALLLERGVVLFEDAMDALLATIADMQRRQRGPRLDRTGSSLPQALQDALTQAMREWDAAGNTAKLWAKDPSLWTRRGEEQWLAWLDEVDRQREHQERLAGLQALLESRGLTHVLLLGMGGSSLGPDVLARTFGAHVPKGSLVLGIVDSTDPTQIAAIEASVPLSSTLFIVSSKSGSTLEPKVLLSYFLERMEQVVGADRAGGHFIAITDPGSQLEAFAKEHRFLRVFSGVPQIGGRFSVFSSFGMVPAAVMGMDTTGFLDEAALMVDACRNDVAADNPGVQLGLMMGLAAKAGRDKLTLVASPRIAPFGAWLEQLVAESTGKQGKAIIPLEGELLLPPERYGDDRLFVHLRLRSTPHAAQDRAMAAIEAAGHAVVHIELDDVHALSQEMFRWEVATAVAGAVLGINPFDQPDVESAKVETRAMMEAFERDGALPAETPIHREAGLSLFTDEANATALRGAAGEGAGLVALLRAHLGRIRAGDYFALLAYVPMLEPHERALGRVRTRVLERTGNATCLGFGPRFLHSTGQAYKGGPNSGVFLQITCDDAQDLPVPGQRYSFGIVKAAQARGDFEVLVGRERRALRIHLGADVGAGLAALDTAISQASSEEDTGA
ncbi:bifunctional transaldolase/phosoglucose isomerase [Paraliomyxa miuraensis]|uniref:bifunctional transaldolase/phosoglucose isomerase n=1 Tax=Paraliomyxa miuraensis TaxID=376150 RepID=UPI00224E104B|nr:bifunctional transaldolase/phosoglucose isomerase [Paraliomyxa miuraensis]MCX4246294.1 bifunctional transaldolase/phosoglucose isomerase [Paraliomyxa miuraensis]